jgi:hypothetical protein
MTIDTSADAVAKVLALATQGKPVQFNPQFCEEAKGAKAHDWDTSHDLSVIRADGSRYKIGHFRHADDALFDQLARELVPALSRDLEAMRAEREEAIAALEAVEAQVRDDTVRSAAIAAGNAIVAIAADADPDISPLRKQMLRVKMEKAVKAAFTRDA